MTELPLQRWRDLGTFLLSTWRLQGQLRRTPGLLGYALRARLRQRRFWTLAVWEGEEVLQQFVVENPHGHGMRALRGQRARRRFVQWSIRGAALPPLWRDALARREAG